MARTPSQPTIPPRLLQAIALAESGRHIGGRLVPWPWTLNIAGKSHYYATRAEAERALREALSRGITSIDIGLMQINWKYNGREYFSSPEQALNPYLNLVAAADILAREAREHGGWFQAVGAYHTGSLDTPERRERAARYRQRVAAHYRRLTRASGASSKRIAAAP